MAVLNGVFAATIMIPLHYAPPNATRGIGFSMSFGIAAVLVVLALWILRWLLYSSLFLFRGSQLEDSKQHMIIDSIHKGYRCLPSFHIKEMWRPGLLSGLLYSLGNLMGIVSIQKLGNFMGYSLNQSSMIVSGKICSDMVSLEMNLLLPVILASLLRFVGLWGICYYKEIAGTFHIVGFLISVCIVFVGVLLLGREHVVD